MKQEGYRIAVQIQSYGGEVELLDKQFYFKSLEGLENCSETFIHNIVQEAQEIEKEEGVYPLHEYDETPDF